ncbi:uncharacterized protein I303_104063 [Kwoniella dejecticola CBS 10117]|uniref:Uncharacterized protein n=1 Tax=Kwoniella dejecticola CBS 10117 TaxID=1296121 RepID=A0A1A6A8H9_9TREE|nr:uncharacterized protein I303_04082 [Kwoniella dejecticola CBS 10117]OBR86358.1 hypothetical protein I303_04082 [Kwoniella dejecticola CBS 10117]
MFNSALLLPLLLGYVASVSASKIQLKGSSKCLTAIDDGNGLYGGAPTIVDCKDAINFDIPGLASTAPDVIRCNAGAGPRVLDAGNISGGDSVQVLDPKAGKDNGSQLWVTGTTDGRIEVSVTGQPEGSPKLCLSYVKDVSLNTQIVTKNCGTGPDAPDANVKQGKSIGLALTPLGLPKLSSAT